MFCKKETYLIFLLFFTLSCRLSAQTEGEKQYFGYNDLAQVEISVFESGEYAVVASSNQSAVILFFDACGDTLWTHEYFKNDNYGRVIRAQNDNEFLYLAAALGASSDTAIGLIKLDKSGRVVFSKGISSSDTYRWYQFHIDRNNNLYFTGNSTSTGNSLASMVLKLDDQGQEIHAFQYGASFIWGMSVPSQSGGILNTTGRTLFKLDANGGVEWTKIYSGFSPSIIPPISLSDGYLIFKSFAGAIKGVFKIDLQGNFLWSSDVFLNVNFTSATLDPAGNIIISFTTFGNNGAEWGLQKVSPSGSNLGSWTLPYSAGDGVFSKDLKFLNDQTMILAGRTDFDFATYSALALRYLPLNLNDLVVCKATLTGLQVEASQVTLVDPNTPNFTPFRFNLFQINNAPFTTGATTINESNFCQNSHADFEFDLGADSLICANSELLLKSDSSANNFNYLWSTGERSAEITITEQGLYWLEISNDCGSFTFRDSIFIAKFPPSNFHSSFSPEKAFPGEEITFSGQGIGNFNWHFNGEIKLGESVKFTASSAFADGVIVEFIDTNSCYSYDTLYPQMLDAEIYMPNAFSPNSDGLNDVFGLEPGTVFSYELTIYDRYGARLVNLVNESWNGGDYSGGAYVYVLKYQIGIRTQTKTLKGVVNLIK